MHKKFNRLALFNGWIILLCFLTGCSAHPEQDSHEAKHWQMMNCREETTVSERRPLYRAQVPDSWIRRDPLPGESLLDTTKAICEFHIAEGTDLLRLTVHSFPVNSVQSRIPPLAQIARWKNQFEELDPLSVQVSPHSHGGFIGLVLEAEGIYQGKLQKMLGWSMQLAPEYDRQLLSRSDDLANRLRRADYTIKITGPSSLMRKHRKALFRFANSFELIEELPSPL